MRKGRLHLSTEPIRISRTPGGICVSDHVKIDRPGWCGHGEIGAVSAIQAHGVYVRLGNGQCFRMLEKFLTKANQPDCKLKCCAQWREPDGDREVLQETIQDL